MSGESSSEEEAPSSSRGRGAKAPKAPKQSKAEKKAEKAKAAIRKKAAAVREKLSDLLKGARAVLAHECVDDLAEGLVNPLRAAVKELRLIEQLCLKASRTGVDTFSEVVAAFDKKAFKGMQAKLAQKLAKARRAAGNS